MFEGLQTARMKVRDRMENADVRTMRLVLLPSCSISNYEKFTASDKVFLIPSAIKADTPEPLRLADLPRACMGEFKSSAFVRGKCVFFPLRFHYMSNFLKLQLCFAFDLVFFFFFAACRFNSILKMSLPFLHAFTLRVGLAKLVR